MPTGWRPDGMKKKYPIKIVAEGILAAAKINRQTLAPRKASACCLIAAPPLWIRANRTSKPSMTKLV